MTNQIIDLWSRLQFAGQEFIVLSVIFALAAIGIKGRQAISDGRKAAKEFRLNLTYLILDTVWVLPLVGVVAQVERALVEKSGVRIFDPAVFENAAWPVTLFLAVAVIDLTGYWRHRLMHSRILWPVHAIHHSDRELTWLSLVRFHPVNRLIAVAASTAVLAVLGVPAWAIWLGYMTVHYYGYFVHADIPWKFGLLRYVLVSPMMHRWHHIRNLKQSGKNFATVFSLYDVVFGTYYVPDTSVGLLGIEEENIPVSWLGQTVHPFAVWARRIGNRRQFVAQQRD